MRVLITAGPTREAIDAVRFISNRSSGKVGVALAEAAVAAGHEVTLLLGPPGSFNRGDAALPYTLVRFESAVDLQRVLGEYWPQHDVLIMAAAVADYRPVRVVAGKLPRRAGERLTLELEPTPDLVAQAAGGKRADQRVIAFALEEASRLEARAAEKMGRKGVDAIVANPLAAMEADTIAPTLLLADGRRVQPEAPGAMSKAAFARWLVEQLAVLW